MGGSSRPEPTDNTTGKICPIGGYCEQGVTAAEACDPGEYGPYIGAKDKTNDCHACVPGFYCPGLNAAEAIITCTAKYYCPRSSATLPLDDTEEATTVAKFS